MVQNFNKGLYPSRQGTKTIDSIVLKECNNLRSVFFEELLKNDLKKIKSASGRYGYIEKISVFSKNSNYVEAYAKAKAAMLSESRALGIFMNLKTGFEIFDLHSSYKIGIRKINKLLLRFFVALKLLIDEILYTLCKETLLGSA